MRLLWVACLVAVAAGACSSRPAIPDFYTVEPVGFIEYERPAARGNCDFNYRSQLLRIDPSSGAVVWELELPHTQGELIVDGQRIVTTVGYTDDEPPGLIAVRRDGGPE